LTDNRWQFGTSDGLPGVVRQGEYVVYQSTAPVGFVAGTTTAAGAPVAALVSIDGGVLAALAGVDGHYRLVGAPGAATVRARVPGTNLAGNALATITAGETATADIVLQGVATVATVKPADKAIGVDRTTQVSVATTAPLDPATVTPDHFRLYRGTPADGVEVAVQVELAASATTVGVIPQAQLAPGTLYTFQASGIKDVYGEVVLVPETSFTTKVEVPPSYDTNKIEFSMPDADGQVAITMPPGTLPPGTTILVVNQASGVVMSFTVGNDGALHETLPASVGDRLTITISDPSGSSVTFDRSQYTGTDGTVALGTAGGTIEAPGGFAVRVPDGALQGGTVFSIKPVSREQLPSTPDLPDVTFASGLEMSTRGPRLLDKEVDLVFPRPP
ncbi:MAG TPA: Ig-like domain-containing protein, partial [Acidimicrobiales bacterium]|nr:Ig-like domain-containing protein [Acidimicrobiales bacterium]